MDHEKIKTLLNNAKNAIKALEAELNRTEYYDYDEDYNDKFWQPSSNC